MYASGAMAHPLNARRAGASLRPVKYPCNIVVATGVGLAAIPLQRSASGDRPGICSTERDTRLLDRARAIGKRRPQGDVRAGGDTADRNGLLGIRRDELHEHRIAALDDVDT